MPSERSKKSGKSTSAEKKLVKGPYIARLKPRETKDIKVATIEDSELPLVFARTGSVLSAITGRNTVKIINNTDGVVDFALFVVDPRVAHAVTFPWGRFLSALKTPGGPESFLRALLKTINRKLINGS